MNSSFVEVHNYAITICDRLVELCKKLNVEYYVDYDTATFYFDKKRIYGNSNLNAKEFIQPIYESIYKQKLLI